MRVRTIERLLLLLMAVLYGCSTEANPRPLPTSQLTAPDQQALPVNCPKVGVILPKPDPSLPWQFDHKSALQREFRLQLPDVRVNIVTADSTSDSQLQIARELIDGGTCILLVSAETGVMAAMIYRLAWSKGIPVVAYDGPASDPESTIRVGFDYHYAGILAGRWIEKRLPTEYGVLVLSGPDDAYESRLYKEGLMQRLTAQLEMGRIRQISTLTWKAIAGTQPDSEWAHSLISTRHEERWLVCSPTPDMAMALADFSQSILGQAVRKQRMYIVGAGLNLATVQAVASGRLSMVIGFDVRELAMHAVQVVRLIRLGASIDSLHRDSSAIDSRVSVHGILVRPMLVDADTVTQSVIDSGLFTLHEFCSGAAAQGIAACK